MSRPRPSEIAIVGMGCRFPGAVELTTYFENILAGTDCISDVPADRWDAATFRDSGSAANDRVATARGGYLDTPIWFDAAAHGVMPRTVEGGEPEQFLVLESAMAALADAGLAVDDLKSRRVDVVIGRGNYFNRGNLTRLQRGRMVEETLAVLSALHPEWSATQREAIRVELKSSLPPFEAATIPGQLTNATAGRVASRLDTRGSAFVVDAASASSLVAVDLAVRALLAGRADLAIAGGVYLEADVDFPLVFRQLGVSSRSGTLRPFSAGADGTLSGEGVGVVILKRRLDAEREGDRIYALIQGVGIASDGRGRGLAAPSARGHVRALKRAYRQSGVDPATVGLVEGHGLGVAAADRAELRALLAVFPPPRFGRRALGAVSSMIGHAMPAAGMAGLIKAALALHHRVLPPTLHAEEPPHPLLDQAASAFALNRVARPWIQADTDPPRRAGVNAFGFAGINAHAVLEEHPASARAGAPGALCHWDTEAVLLAAPDRAGLIDRARALVDWIGRGHHARLKDVAYTLNRESCRLTGGVRLGLVVPSVTELASRLDALVARLADPACHTIRDARGAYFWEQPLLKTAPGGLAFLFPGEGSQYSGMLGDLCIHFPEVRRMFDIADRIAIELGETVPPSEKLYQPGAGDGGQLWSTATAVNVVLTSQRALHWVLTRLGLVADAVAGHSSGEILALAAAGVLRADGELERQLGRLGEIFRGFEQRGDVPEARLVAVATHRDRALATCRELAADSVVVAIDNCPHQVVLAGPPADVDRVVNRLRADNIPFEILPFDRAYHTASFSPVVGPIAQFFDSLDFRAPKVPVYSCATRQRMPADPAAIRALAVDQWTRTVAFRETIETMHADGLRVFIDVGARGNLAGFVEDILRGKPAFAVAANVPRRSGLTQLNHLVAATFAQGANLDTDFLHARRRPLEIDWSAPVPPQRAMVELKIGFPRMRLSETLVEQLRASETPGPLREHRADAQQFECYGGTHCEERSPSSWREPEALQLANGYAIPYPNRIGSDSNGHDRHGRIELANWEDDAVATATATEHDDAILSFQETMREFLDTQEAVMTAYLGSGVSDRAAADQELDFRVSPGGDHSPPAADSSARLDGGQTSATTTAGPAPGPWSGELVRLDTGREVETVLLLDACDDPLAHHHTLGGRRTSALDPSLKGLPVLPFAAMAEMTAQVAAIVITPGLVLTRLEQVKAHKWLRYEEKPARLRMLGRRVESDGDERAWVGIYKESSGGNGEPARPVFEAIAVFGSGRSQPPPARSFCLDHPRASRFTAQTIYRDGWLFHGPPLQALVHIGHFSDQGIDGTLRVLPWAPLLRPGQEANLHVDPIILDAFTHLLGCWGLDFFSEGDVVFPLRMEELEIHGERPADGTDVACRITIREIERHRIRAEAEVVRPDGTVWMRIRDWEDWRFYWPGRFRDVFRQPQAFFVGEELVLERADTPRGAEACMVWLEPPADMGRPIWRDVLEQTQLGPAERAGFLASAGTDERRSHRLWGRVAAKEAARRLWRAAGGPPVYPADLAIEHDDQGRPALVSLDRSRAERSPAISIAHSNGVAVALASADPDARIGVDVESIVDRPPGFEEAAFTPAERLLLSEVAEASRSEWVARFWCAKEAAAKSTGMGMAAGPATAQVIEADRVTGRMIVALASIGSRNEPNPLPAPEMGVGKLRNEASRPSRIRVVSCRRGASAWAWTLGEGVEP